MNVGDGEAGEPNDGEVDVKIHDETLIYGKDKPIAVIVESIYFDLEDHIWESTYFQDSAILAPTNEIVEIVSDHVLP